MMTHMAHKIRIVFHEPSLDLVGFLDVPGHVLPGSELSADGTQDQFSFGTSALIVASEQMPHLDEPQAVGTQDTSRLVLFPFRSSPEQSLADFTAMLEIKLCLDITYDK
jgi:hypothetical protein